MPAELTDLSTHACYLKINAPFPLRRRVALVMKAGIHDLRAEGTVRITHAEMGMGVEFLQKTQDEQAKVAESWRACVVSRRARRKSWLSRRRLT